MREDERIKPGEVEDYILIDNSCKKYDVLFGWYTGTKLRRISKWYSGNGCGAKQAYMVRADDKFERAEIVWDDHVEEITEQMNFFLDIEKEK